MESKRDFWSKAALIFVCMVALELVLLLMGRARLGLLVLLAMRVFKKLKTWSRDSRLHTLSQHVTGRGGQEAVLGRRGDARKGKGWLLQEICSASLLQIPLWGDCCHQGRAFIPSSYPALSPVVYRCVLLMVSSFLHIVSCFESTFSGEKHPNKSTGMKIITIGFCMNMGFEVSDGGAEKEREKEFPV